MENTPIVVIDNFFDQPEKLISLACTESAFKAQVSDYYPGVRKVVPNSYTQKVCSQLLPLLKSNFGFEHATTVKSVLSAFSLSTTPPKELRPIQTVPHFDTAEHNQFALVHYLCDEQHGGTSFYRHRETGFERVTHDRLPLYGTVLKQQAMKERLHENLNYIDGDTVLFERIYSVEARMNRAIIYPSNLLHSGNIRPEMGLSNDPRKGRLTVSSFIQIR